VHQLVAASDQMKLIPVVDGVGRRLLIWIALADFSAAAPESINFRAPCDQPFRGVGGRIHPIKAQNAGVQYIFASFLVERRVLDQNDQTVRRRCV
jgi:hypothetical protein